MINLSVDISINNPKQKITLVECLEEYDTFIISKNCKGYEGIYNKAYLIHIKNQKKNEIYHIFEMFDNAIISEEKFKVLPKNFFPRG